MKASSPPEWRDADGLDACDMLSGHSQTARSGQRVLLGVLSHPALPIAPLDEHDALSAALAHLELNEESISSFATEYGYLGVELTFRGTRGTFQGEPYEAWVEAVSILRVVWRELHGKQSEGAPCEFLEIEAVGPPIKTAGTGDAQRYRWQIVLPDGLPDVCPRPESLPLIGTEGFFWCEKPMGCTAVPPAIARTNALADIITKYTYRLVGARVTTDLAGNPDLTFWVDGLLGAAWLQMAQDLVGAESDYQRCPTCQRWFRRKRPDQRTCGRSTCRGKIYEQRRDAARGLYDSGLHPPEIAQRLSSEFRIHITERQVEGWVGASKRRHRGAFTGGRARLEDRTESALPGDTKDGQQS